MNTALLLQSTIEANYPQIKARVRPAKLFGHRPLSMVVDNCVQGPLSAVDVSLLKSLVQTPKHWGGHQEVC